MYNQLQIIVEVQKWRFSGKDCQKTAERLVNGLNNGLNSLNRFYVPVQGFDPTNLATTVPKNVSKFILYIICL